MGGGRGLVSLLGATTTASLRLGGRLLRLRLGRGSLAGFHSLDLVSSLLRATATLRGCLFTRSGLLVGGSGLAATLGLRFLNNRRRSDLGGSLEHGCLEQQRRGGSHGRGGFGCHDSPMVGAPPCLDAPFFIARVGRKPSGALMRSGRRHMNTSSLGSRRGGTPATSIHHNCRTTAPCSDDGVIRTTQHRAISHGRTHNNYSDTYVTKLPLNEHFNQSNRRFWSTLISTRDIGPMDLGHGIIDPNPNTRRSHHDPRADSA